MAGGGGAVSLSVAFVYKHTTTGEVVVVDIERAREIDSSSAMRRGEWKHTSTIDPITVLQLIVKSNGQKRAKIIRELSEQP
jgi:hypothetical protein